ncbi:MAG: hypothetical protein AAGC60_25435 [Acidobacteriota bacterium]
MAQPILTVDTPQRIELRAPRVGPMLLTVLLMIVLLGVGGAFPAYRLAQLVFAGAALWAASGLLRVHDLVLDVEARTWRWRRGWLPRPTTRTGSFETIEAVAIEPNRAVDGLVKSRLRSRIVTLILRPAALEGVDDPSAGVFMLGFPMGPQAAQAAAADYAERLGVALVDRTADEPNADA